MEAGLSYDFESAAPEHPLMLLYLAYFEGLQSKWTSDFHFQPSTQFLVNSQNLQTVQKLLKLIDQLKQPMEYQMLLMAPDLTEEPGLQKVLSDLKKLGLFY